MYRHPASQLAQERQRDMLKQAEQDRRAQRVLAFRQAERRADRAARRANRAARRMRRAVHNALQLRTELEP